MPARLRVVLLWFRSCEFGSSGVTAQRRHDGRPGSPMRRVCAREIAEVKFSKTISDLNSVCRLFSEEAFIIHCRSQEVADSQVDCRLSQLP
jgi:hypothetical protein